ncbi:MAG: DUF2232 domain-containing protein [Smithellaceae bacterium]
MKIFGMLIFNNPFLRMLLILSFSVLAATFVPVVGFTFLIFLPLLTMFYSALYGKVKTATAFLIPVLLIFIFSHLLQIDTPYLVILMLGIVGLTIAAVALRNSSIEKIVVYPALIIIGAICAYFIYSGFVLSVNPWHLVSQFVAQGVEQNINFYSQLPIDKEDISFIKNNKLIFITVFTGIFPALAIIGSIFIVWINVLIGKDILRKSTFFLPQLEGLSKWKAPEFMIWIFIIAGGLLLLPNEQIRFFSLNVFIMICFTYLLQGFAILSFLFQSKNVPVFFRYLFYFLIAVQQLLVIPIAIAGLLDIWVDFRRFFQNNQAAT